jgi:rhamnosyltransferase
VQRIAAEEFNHGGTRNLGASLARGDVLVFTSQDSHAEGDDWLARLTAPLDDPGVAGVYGRQVAHHGAKPPEQFFLDYVYGPAPRTQRAASDAELSMETTLFSNVNAAMRREVLERFPFAGDIIMSEDQEWSRRVLLAGYAVVYEPRAVVRHSHDYTFGDAFRRFFDSGVSAERAYLPDDAGARRALRRRALRYPIVETGWLWRNGHRRWIPYALAYQATKFAGLALGTRHARLPASVNRRLSASPGHWT